MAFKPDHPPRRPCVCQGADPNCLKCGGRGFIEAPGFRSIMASPAGVRRRPHVPRESVGTVPGVPEPIRCPHCGLDVLNLAAHLTEAHPEQPQPEAAAAREAREQEEARQAAVAAELARREAEAAQRKAEARARRQEIEGPRSVVAWPGRARGTPPENPPGKPAVPGPPVNAAAQTDPTAPAGAPDVGPSDGARRRASGGEERPGAGVESRLASPEDEVWGRMRRALADGTVLTGVVCDCKPFGVFVDLGGIEGLVRRREMRAEDAGREAPGPQKGQPVKVVVIAMNKDAHHVELSMRRAGDLRTPLTERGASGPVSPPAEGPMALAFRLAREKKKQT
jgi:hypothetical protein